MKYSKYYIPLIGIYYCIKKYKHIDGTPHFDLTAVYHGIVIASIITVPIFLYLFQ